MSFEVKYSEEAVAQLKKLRAFDRAAILDQIEKLLAANPMLESKSSIKRLRQPAPTQYRMRVGDYRIFYDVDEKNVLVIRILSKAEAIDYLGE